MRKKSAIISLKSGPTKFRNTLVRPYYQEVQEKKKEANGKNIETLGSHDNDKETRNPKKTTQFEERENKPLPQPKQTRRRRQKNIAGHHVYYK